MTGPSERNPAAVVARAALNHPLIRSRAADLGLVDAVFTELAGVSLHRLQHERGHRGVSLIVLVRLARLLEVSLDDLVLVEGVEPTGENGDGSDATVLATYSGLSVGRVLTLLGWTRARLDSALADVAGQLEGTALRVAVTDERLQLLLRTGALPAPVRTRFDRDRSAQSPLDPGHAAALLALVRDAILEPFPAELADDRRRDMQRINIDPAHLIERRIAVPAPRIGGNPHDPGLLVHPDVMFALRLADEPAHDGTPRVRD